MKQDRKNLDVGQAFKAGYALLCDQNTRVPAKDIDDLAAFKQILIRLIKGELVIVTPDVVDRANLASATESTDQD